MFYSLIFFLLLQPLSIRSAAPGDAYHLGGGGAKAFIVNVEEVGQPVLTTKPPCGDEYPEYFSTVFTNLPEFDNGTIVITGQNQDLFVGVRDSQAGQKLIWTNVPFEWEVETAGFGSHIKVIFVRTVDGTLLWHWGQQDPKNIVLQPDRGFDPGNFWEFISAK